jgi:hypothetical protein
MRPSRLPLVLIAAAAIVPGAAQVARAQEPSVSAAPPSACIPATGPDSDTGSVESVMRARSARRAAGPNTQPAALLLYAAVEADELRFDSQPTICVTLRGDARLDSVHIIGRRNLVSPVVRGTTYRDVYVAVEILGHIDAECIAARITGAPSARRGGEVCASLSLRDSTAGRRTGAPPP